MKKIINDISVDELIERSKTNNIVIYGAGDIGKITFWALKNIGITPVLFIVDIDSEWNYQGVPIKPFETVKQIENPLVIVAVAHYIDHLIEALENINITNMFIPLTLINSVKLKPEQRDKTIFEYEIILRNYTAYYENNYREQIYIQELWLSVTEGCSLKCENCLALGDKYKQVRIPTLEEICTNFDMLLSNIDKIGTVSFFHEPFMFKELDKLLERYADNPKINNFTIVTNATILPNKSLLTQLATPKINVVVSDYKEHSYNYENLISLLKENNIQFTLYTEERYGKWVKLNIYDQDNKIDRQSRCVNRLFTLIRNRFYYCPTLANGVNTGVMPDYDRDYLDVNSKDFRNEVRKYLYDRKPLLGCDYCGNELETQTVERAVQAR
ncbi:MAG: hypothetical protein BEN19_05675 [Epulopiscium sp. Nuni2H_MBin003]|nr:MAG: hypothetical protein BEN19_05675 [Epulopiscium sp. Nuni2H_MBin003]